GARRFVGGGGSRFSGGGGGGEFFSFFLSGGKNKTRLCPPSPPPPIATRPTSGAVGAPNHLADSAIPVLSENRLPRCRRSRWPHLVPVSANISALAQLEVSDGIPPASRAAGHQTMADIAVLMERSRANGPLRDAPMGVVAAIMATAPHQRAASAG